MKKLLERAGFRRPDEMERFLTAKAQRNAYFFLTASLLIWSVYESWRVYAFQERLNLLPCGLLIGALAVQTVTRLVLSRNAVKDDEDSFETRPLFRIILFCCAAAAAAAIGAALILTGVRTPGVQP